MSENSKRESEISSSSDSDQKKPRTDEAATNPFTAVGELAQDVDDLVPDDKEQNEQQSNQQDEHTGLNYEVKKTGAHDVEGHPVQEVESLCMNCHKNGTTRLLLTKIPYFREVILMSFSCPHCGFKNSEIQQAGEIQAKGSKYVLQVEELKDLNRQIVKSEWCTCKFAEIDVEIPPRKGQLTTVEGLLSQIRDDLSGDQEARKTIDPDTYEKIEEFLKKVTAAINGEILPLTLTVDDPAGNSYVEFVPGESPHKWSHIEYFRTDEQSRNLGLAIGDDNSTSEEGVNASSNNTSDNQPRNPSTVEQVQQEESEIENLQGEVQTFHATCPACHAPCPTHMKIVNIPHFKDVIIMSTVCERCGYKSNEVKTGGAIPDKGRKITLKVEDPDDLARDILKSETCGMTIPELDLDLTPGTLGGRFTTLEGLLSQVHDELKSRVFTETSDSMDAETRDRWERFLDRLQDGINGNIKFTVIMEDPLAASYIQNVFAPDDDPNMTIEDYERTHQQNEELGLNDMVVD